MAKNSEIGNVWVQTKSKIWSNSHYTVLKYCARERVRSGVINGMGGVQSGNTQRLFQGLKWRTTEDPFPCTREETSVHKKPVAFKKSN
jgi:hypothetical protein